MRADISSEYRDLVDRLDLRSIVMTECAAARQRPTVPTGSRMEMTTGYRIGDDAIGYRFEFTCVPIADEVEIAKIHTVFVADYEMGEGEPPTEPVVLRFAEDVAVMAVYPYAREAIQSLASRLEMSGFTLGLLRRGEISLTAEGLTNT